VITWTPTEAQGPGNFTIRIRALDNGSPPLSSTNTFVLSVTETNNNGPVLPTQTNRTVIETLLMSVVNAAADADVPANTLTYSLLTAPTGAAVSAGGLITWTPNDSQGGTTNTFTTRVVDNVAPTLSATNTFTVIVLDTNNVPVLPTQTNRTIAEFTTLTVTNTATDTDNPTNSFTYTLLASPPGAAISAIGVITWTTSETNGPSTNIFTTRVLDDGVPPLSATNSFSVTVTEVNSAPILPSQANVTIAELTTLRVTNTASDNDLPANSLTYALLNPPGNAAISTNGVITWTPQENEGPGTNTITTVANDGAASVTNQFVVIVGEINSGPGFVASPGDRTIDELTLLTVTNSAADADLPANTLTYTLVDAPANVAISTNGVITWTPTEAEGPGTNTITTVVSDGVLSVTNQFVVTVREVATAPLFVAAPTNLTIDELTSLVVTNNALDADLPADGLTYSLLNGPLNATISTNGVISWAPTEAEGPSTNTITTVVSDGALSTTNSFVVTVSEVNESPAFLATPANQTIDVLNLLTVTNVATDSDFPANALSYSLFDPPAGMMIDTHGVIVWTPTEAQSSTTNTVTTVVTDNGIPALTATNVFHVTVIGQITPPTIQSITLSNGLVTVVSSGINERNYRLQFKPGLGETNWSDVFPSATATGGIVILTNAAGTASESYYRVYLEPLP